MIGLDDQPLSSISTPTTPHGRSGLSPTPSSAPARRQTDSGQETGCTELAAGLNNEYIHREQLFSI